MNIDIYSLIKLFDITISRRDNYEAWCIKSKNERKLWVCF
jgi:hypothetical protein